MRWLPFYGDSTSLTLCSLLGFRAMICIYSQAPTNASLSLSMLVVSLRRQRMALRRYILLAATETTVYAGYRRYYSWRMLTRKLHVV